MSQYPAASPNGMQLSPSPFLEPRSIPQSPGKMYSTLQSQPQYQPRHDYYQHYQPRTQYQPPVPQQRSYSQQLPPSPRRQPLVNMTQRPNVHLDYNNSPNQYRREIIQPSSAAPSTHQPQQRTPAQRNNSIDHSSADPGSMYENLNIMRSSSMRVSPVPPVALKYQQTYVQPSYSRYLEQNYEEQQHRQYEQYEQQSRYYREAVDSQLNPNDNPQTASSEHQTMYNHPNYPESSNPMQSPILSHGQVQARTPQLQARPPLSLGLFSANQFAVARVAREKLPTAPSPPIFSSAQPEPIFQGQNSEEHDEKLTEAIVQSTVSDIGSPHPSPERVSQAYIKRPANRNSLSSTYSVGSPVIHERVVKSLPPTCEPVLRSNTSLNVTNQQNTKRGMPLVRSSSDSNWNMSPNSMAAYSSPRPRPQQSQSYSRQLTLSSIPSNEAVPPIPGKIASKTGKIRIQLTFDKPFFNAGGELSGRLEIQCSVSRSVMLSDMIIELLGYETLAKDQSTPKVFHKTILRLQDSRRPSQAVQENIDPDSEGYWVARKGRTIFPFRINIQDKLPNSYESKLGSVRYVASAIARMKTNNQKEIVNHTREIFIYETWTTDDVILARRKSVKADTSKRLFMGGEGSLEMYAELTRAMVSSGGIVYVNVGVKNLTKKKIMGIKLALWRYIFTNNRRSSSSSQITLPTNRDQDSTKNYCEIIYKGEDYAFDNDDPRVVVLPIYIPSGVYSLRNTTYLKAQFYVQVSLMTSMSKNLTLELPIYITHASSWSDPPPRIPKDFAFPTHENDPVRKNKTGLFSTKKVQVTQSHGNNNDPRKLQDSVRNSRGSFSAPNGQANISVQPQGNTRDGACSRPATKRSSLKDPDSPTSVLDFSQAGNLFVVNPDTASIRRSSTNESLISAPTITSNNAISQHVLQFPPVSINPVPVTTLSTNSVPGSRMDKQVNEIVNNIQIIDDGQDFDMSRSVSPSQYNSNKKEQEKSKTGKMGLRKTLAKLSIAIPSQSSTFSSLKSKSGVSPSGQGTASESDKIIKQDSPEVSPGDTRSPSEITILSRNSSGSSLKSLKRMMEGVSRKSSVGSTRVMDISPGSISPSQCYHADPCTHNVTSIELDGQTEKISPIHHHGQLAMTQIIPGFTFHQGTPLLEERGSEGYFDLSGNDSRTPTSVSSGNRGTTNQSSPNTPNSFTRPWDLQTNFSNSSVTSIFDTLEGAQTAKAVRDEYYHSRTNSRRSSYETRIAPVSIDDHSLVDSQNCNASLSEVREHGAVNLSEPQCNGKNLSITTLDSGHSNTQYQSEHDGASIHNASYSIPVSSPTEIHNTQLNIEPQNYLTNQLLPPSQYVIPDNAAIFPERVPGEEFQLDIGQNFNTDPTMATTSDVVFRHNPVDSYDFQHTEDVPVPTNLQFIATTIPYPPTGMMNANQAIVMGQVPMTVILEQQYNRKDDAYCYPPFESQNFSEDTKPKDINHHYVGISMDDDAADTGNNMQGYSSGVVSSQPSPRIGEEKLGFSIPEMQQLTPDISEQRSSSLSYDANTPESRLVEIINENNIQNDGSYDANIQSTSVKGPESTDHHIIVAPRSLLIYPKGETEHIAEVPEHGVGVNVIASAITGSPSVLQLHSAVAPSINEMEPQMNHVEVLPPVFTQSNPYSCSLYNPEGLNDINLNENEYASTQYLQPMIGNQAVARIKGTFRPSPLAFEGNVITAEPSPTFSSEFSIKSPVTDNEGMDSYSKECISPMLARSHYHSPTEGVIAGTCTEDNEKKAETRIHIA